MFTDEFERFDAASDGPFDLVRRLLEFLVRGDDGVLRQRHLVACPEQHFVAFFGAEDIER